MKADKLYLVGFMGAGKTTVARAIGKHTGWRVEDIDRAHRVQRASDRRVDLFPTRRALFPATGAAGAWRAAAAPACGDRNRRRDVRRAGQPRADARRWRSRVAGAVVGPGDRARACRWTPPARLRSGADGTTLRETATGVRAGARTGRCVETGPRGGWPVARMDRLLIP